MKASAAALAALLAAGCAAGPRVRVDAEGWAPLGPGGERAAREEALADARRRAVERGAGVRVTARSVVVDGAASSQRVSARSAGAVRSWRVLAEEREQGGVRVLIRAEVERPGTEAAWPAGTAAFVEPGPAAPALARAWSSAGGNLAARREDAELILSASISSAAVSEPRARPFVSRRARATLRLSSDDGEFWMANGEGAALGFDAGEAEGLAAQAALAAAVTAARR